jgi:anhydro-N-acetylmuramic acid kinase
MATLCYITAKSIQINLSLLPTNPKTILIIGGGQNNLTLIQMLKNLMPNQIKTGEDVNINSNFVEAELMAYLAARRLFNLPVTFPSTTGIRLPSTAGILLKI